MIFTARTSKLIKGRKESRLERMIYSENPSTLGGTVLVEDFEVERKYFIV